MDTHLSKLFGIIAVAHDDDRTFYVRRSQKMINYPGVWSLPSIQFDPRDIADLKDPHQVQRYMEKISSDRIGGVQIKAKAFLTSGDSTDNPISRHVFLHLYAVELSIT